MKKIALTLLLALVVLVGILFFNFFTVPSKQLPTEGNKTDISSIQGADQRIAQSLTYQTISHEDTAQIDFTPFLEFHNFLRGAFPLVFNNLDVELVSNYTMVLHWKGADSTLKPGILLAHMDVVPVSDDTRALWTVPPFEGVIKGDLLYGRGAVDNKINLMAQLESIDFLLKSNFKPKRDLYFVFGHDEEIGGTNGAQKVAELMHSRGIQAEFVLDEGGFVTNDKVPGVNQPVALIGTSEKGFLNVELSLNIEGGHSSMPEKENAVNVMSKALSDLSEQPFSPSLTPSVKDFIEHIAPHSVFINRLAMSNMWLFKPLIYNIYSSAPTSDAMIRTTMVPTIIRGGEKANVIPNIVTATINYRLLPGTSVADAIAHTEKAINNPLIKVTALREQKEATGVSPSDTEPFRYIMNAIQLNFDSVIVAPFLMIAGTDSRHFGIVTPNIYKFSPMIDPVGFHGVDEFLNLKDYKKGIGFYVDFIKNL